MINSTDEFIEITRNIKQPNMLASLDVESLFTNIPVDETINIIIQEVYNHPSLPPLEIPAESLRNLLKICTTKTPFKSPNGDIYLQTDGVSMGSPLGPTFANFYAGHIENKVFTEKPHLKPEIYCRFVDDSFLVIKKFSELEILKQEFENCSCLKYTYEIESCKKIPFLDVMVTRSADSVKTAVYVKPTSNGECMNFDSICPKRYKIGVIKTLLHRSYSICSDFQTFYDDVQRIKQMLVNNNFPNFIVDKTIKTFIDNKNNVNNAATPNNPSVTSANLAPTTSSSHNSDDNLVKYFYENQMTENYVRNERNLRKTVMKHVIPTENRKIKLMIFYRNRKLRNLFIKNNPNKIEQSSNLIYKYACNKQPCTEADIFYIGRTTVTLKERFNNHKSIKTHYKNIHHQDKITGSQMLPHVSVIDKCSDRIDLCILEALYIKELNPVINKQVNDFARTLKIF